MKKQFGLACATLIFAGFVACGDNDNGSSAINEGENLSSSVATVSSSSEEPEVSSSSKKSAVSSSSEESAVSSSSKKSAVSSSSKKSAASSSSKKSAVSSSSEEPEVSSSSKKSAASSSSEEPEVSSSSEKPAVSSSSEKPAVSSSSEKPAVSSSSKKSAVSSSSVTPPASSSSEEPALSSSSVTPPASSSSEEPALSSSSVTPPASSSSEDPCANKTLKSNEICDSRDGNVYRTLEIGGLTWMAENLRYYSFWSEIHYENVDYDMKYGRLYYDISNTLCPAGWRFPTKSEAEAVMNIALADANNDAAEAAKLLKATTGWNEGKTGTDKYGFSAYGAGNCGDNCWSWGTWTAFWTYDRESTYNYYRFEISDEVKISYESTDIGHSIRCVKVEE